MGLLDPIICFPLSPACWGEVLLHGDVDGPAIDRLIDVLRLYRQQFGEPLDPALTRGLMSEAEAMKETAKERFAAECRPKPEPSPTPLPDPRDIKPAARPKGAGHVEVTPTKHLDPVIKEMQDRGCKSRYDIYRLKVVEYLLRSGKPIARTELIFKCGIPPGSSSPIFNDTRLFVSTPQGKVWLAPDAETTTRELTNRMPPRFPKADSDEDLDPDLSLDLSELSDEQRQAYAEVRKRQELERAAGR